MKEVNAPNCGRDNDLIAFLYGELNDNESQIFRRHVHDCAACSTELASFQNVRESVVAWRDESLGGVISPVRVADSMPTRSAVAKPSAFAALREFFNLAPLWMKGAVAVASILFCLFAGLAIARLRETPPAPIVAIPGNSAPTEEQVNARVQRLVQEELERKRNSATPPPVFTSAGDKGLSRSPARRIPVSAEIANNSTQKARRPLSKTEREQLAADLRLVSARNEGELDLLDDGVNQ